MQAERDYIRKFVLPGLEHELARTNIILQITDLRWGVDTRSVEENQREATVLHVCLNAIRNTRPFFIRLI